MKKTILFVFILLLASSIFYRSPVIDEPLNIARGANILVNHNMHMSIAHPPLLNILSAIPLLFLDLESPETQAYEPFAHKLLYGNKYEPYTILRLAGISSVIISVLLGLLIYFIAKRIYSKKAAIFALFLYAFHPVILGHSRLSTPDIGLTFFIFLTFFVFMWYKDMPTAKRLFLLSVVSGLTLSTKFTSVIIIPFVMTSIFLIHYQRFKLSRIMSLFKSYMVYIFVIIVTINCIYFFEGSFVSLGKSIDSDTLLDRDGYFEMRGKLPGIVLFGIDAVPSPLPYNYVRGFISQAVRPSEPCYFSGSIHNSPPWYSSFVVFFIKSSIVFIVLIGLAFFSLRRLKLMKDENWIIFALVYFFLVLNLIPYCRGIRYFLPVFPFVFIFISRSANVFRVDYKAAILLLAYAIVPLTSFPEYLYFYNEIVGQNNGCTISLDGDCDFGQGADRIKPYLNAKGIINPNIAYHGTEDLSYYNFTYAPLEFSSYASLQKFGKQEPICHELEGITIISMFQLYNYGEYPNCFDWLQKYKPIDRLAPNILVYNITNSAVKTENR